MTNHQPTPTRAQIAVRRLSLALGFEPETGADEWLEAVADAAAADPSVALALVNAYKKRDTIGWAKIRVVTK